MLRTAAVSILGATALAACGGSNKPTGSARQSLAAARSDAIAYSRCMRSHGVPNFPDLGGHGGGISIQASQTAGSGRTLTVNGVPVSAPAFQSAQQSCQKYLPKGPAPSAAQLTRLRAGALAMARCMRAHGVPNFPDPVITTGPGGHGVGVRVRIGGPGSGFDPNSPAFLAAQQTCGHLMGGFGFKAPPHTPAGSSTSGSGSA
jgi:hypothetical protein